MNRRHRVALTMSLVVLLALGACGTQSISPTSAPGAGKTAVATPEPTVTPFPSPTSTPIPTPIPNPISTPVALSFVQMPTQILVGGRTNADTGTANDNYGFYSVDTDGTNLRRVDPAGMVNVYPSWSPDGKQIAYTRVLNISAMTGWPTP